MLKMMIRTPKMIDKVVKMMNRDAKMQGGECKVLILRWECKKLRKVKLNLNGCNMKSNRY